MKNFPRFGEGGLHFPHHFLICAVLTMRHFPFFVCFSLFSPFSPVFSVFPGSGGESVSVVGVSLQACLCVSPVSRLVHHHEALDVASICATSTSISASASALTQALTSTLTLILTLALTLTIIVSC